MKICAAIFIFLICHTRLTAKTFHVGATRKFQTITSAILSSSDGDTVLVDGGLYRERNLLINKRIILRGLDRPILDGEKKYEVISIRSNGVVLEGFKIINSGISSMDDIGGIKIYDCRDVIIENNLLEDTFFGIYAQHVINCTIRNNHLNAHRSEEQQSGNGIHCWKSDSMRIIGNSITGHRDGIYFEFVTNSIIWRNTSTHNLRYGLHFMFSHSNTYVTNIFQDNGAGVSIMYSHHVRMFNNYFEDNWGDGSYGLLLKEIADSYVGGNWFVKNTTGIHMEGASRVIMEKNKFYNNGWAMQIQASCMDVTVVNNNFIGNTFDIGTNGSLMLNTFDNNYWDKYEGYDINGDRIGDVPFRPVSLYSMIVEKNPPAMMLFRSFITSLMDKTEKILPGITPENLKDEHPLMKKILD